MKNEKLKNFKNSKFLIFTYIPVLIIFFSLILFLGFANIFSQYTKLIELIEFLIFIFISSFLFVVGKYCFKNVSKIEKDTSLRSIFSGIMGGIIVAYLTDTQFTLNIYKLILLPGIFAFVVGVSTYILYK